MNIYEKLLAARQEIGYLQKDGKVAFGSTSYKAITDEKVMTTVRPILDKYGILMLIENINMSRNGNLTEAVISWRFVNAEDPKESILVQSAGQGSDTQDKGAGKAMTYSRKYALLNTLLIPTGEDPDKISSEELDAKEDPKPKVEIAEDKEDAYLTAMKAIAQIAELKSVTPSNLIEERSNGMFKTSVDKLTIPQLRMLFTDIKGLPNV